VSVCVTKDGQRPPIRERRLKSPAHGYFRATVEQRKEAVVGIGVSLILAAVGAILIWAVDVEVSGVDLTVVGVILLVVGCVGALLSLVFWSSWGGFGGRSESRTTVVGR
jgi:hypothetical protein